MAGIYSILDTGKWSLHAQQMGIAVTSHNVANVNTPGYSRQRLVLEPAKPQDFSPGQLGRGVRPVAIERVYDNFLGIQLRQELGAQGNLSTQASYYRQLESIYSGLSDSDLGSQFQTYWQAWEELSLHPEGSAQRVAVKEAAVQVASRIKGLRDKLTSLRDQLNRSLDVSVQRVNELTSHIAELNVQIARSKGSGQNPNDLKDMRDTALDELAGILDIQYWEAPDGTVSIMGPGGMALVIGTESWALGLKEREEGITDVIWKDSHGNQVLITDHISSGSIGGILRMRDHVVIRELEELHGLARELIWETNVRFSGAVPLSAFSSLSGSAAIWDDSVPVGALDLPFSDRITDGVLSIWIYDGSDPPAPAGRVDVAISSSTTTAKDLVNAINSDPQNGGRILASVSNGRLVLEGQGGARLAIAQDTSHVAAALGLNVFFSGSNATDISVSQAISEEPLLIGTALVDVSSGEFSPGDNRAVLRILELRETPIQALHGQTLEGLWSSRVSAIGVEAAASYRTSEYQDQVVGQLQDQRSSVSGVNLDEEMVKLLEYQWAYQAAARLIQTAREMLDTVMNILE